MKIEKTTIVTALFDIGRDKWDNYHQSYDTYLTWMKNILSIDSSMVIYTEKKFEEFILSERKKVDEHLIKTIVVTNQMEELESYNLFYDKIKNLMYSEDFKRKIHFQVPEMTKPLYNTIIFNKLFFIRESIENKHFDSDMYIWCDAGMLRNDSDKGKTNVPNLEKVNNGYNKKITFFSHSETFPKISEYEHLLGQYRFIHGGCFFVPNNGSLEELINDFVEMVYEFLQKGYVGSEEKYLDLCFLKKTNNFNLVKSDWRQYFEIFK
jgi:hypothetical protein